MKIGVLLATGAGAVALGIADTAYRARDWGASGREVNAVYPGDDLVAEPADNVTRAVSVHAPAGEVWKWLVQIGQDRGGMYSYDRLENLIGLRIRSADRIEERWQHLAVGDVVRLIPKGWLGLREGYALPVAQLVPGRSIVLREDPADGPWDAVWSFHVVPTTADRCRLVTRSRAGRGGLAGRLAAILMDPVTLLMTRRMLLGIKQRAERSAGATAVTTSAVTTSAVTTSAVTTADRCVDVSSSS
jgi:hypothetical protein